MANKSSFSAELEALSVVLDALAQLEKEQQEFVYQTVGERLGLTARARQSASKRGSTGGSGGENDEAADSDADVTPKEFLRTRNPKTDAERVTCLAYYLTHHRGESRFKTKELTVLNTEAAQPRLTNISQTAKNATNQNKYLAQAGGGQKMITALGEDVVNALPDRDAVQTVLDKSNRTKPRKKHVAKKNTKR